MKRKSCISLWAIVASYCLVQTSSASPLVERRWNTNAGMVHRPVASLWDVVFFVIGHHCPPGPLGKKCRDEEAALAAANANAAGANGDANGSASGSGSDGGGGGGGGDGSGGDGSGGDGSGGDGSGGNGSGGDHTSGGGGSSAANSASTPKVLSSNNGRMMMIFAACIACSAALASIVVGMRKTSLSNQNHALFGALKKRSILFRNMADRAQPSRPKSHEEASNYQLV